MKPIVLSLFLLSLFVQIDAQPLSWLWAYGASGNVQAEGNDIKTDPSGNVYVLGSFYTKLIGIGTDTILSTDTATYTYDFFLIKYSPAGSVIWSKAIGTNGNTLNNPVMTTDAIGNLIVGGTFSGPLLVLSSGDTLRNTDSSGRDHPFFLAKYTPSGNVAWAVKGDSTIVLNAIVTDAAGNIYAAGKLTDTVPAIWGSDTLINAGYNNVVVGKYDSTGNAIWASRLGGTQYDQAQSITVDAAGNSYVLGVYSSPVITSGSVTLTDPSGNTNFFVAKYDTSGNIAWAQGITGAAANSGPGNAITSDANGNLYVTGILEGDSINLGNITLINPDNAGYPDLFIAKYNTSGTTVWAKSAPTDNAAFGYAITTGSNGNIYLTGSFSDTTIIFGTDTLHNPDTIDYQPEALYIAEFDTAGNTIWATAAGGSTEGDYPNAIATDAAGDVYVTGYFYASYIAFGNDTLQGTTVDEASTVFIAKYGSTINGIAVPSASLSTITVYPNPSTGQFYFKGITPGNPLEVYDVLGQNIFSAIVTGDNYLLNISGHAKGIYFYHVTDKGGNVQQGKIVLE